MDYSNLIKTLRRLRGLLWIISIIACLTSLIIGSFFNLKSAFWTANFIVIFYLGVSLIIAEKRREKLKYGMWIALAVILLIFLL